MVAPQKESMAEKPLTSVMEDYLEAIFDLDQEKKFIRVKDIAKRMDVKMPTVSSMLKTLNERGGREKCQARSQTLSREFESQVKEGTTPSDGQW